MDTSYVILQLDGADSLAHVLEHANDFWILLVDFDAWISQHLFVIDLFT